jgi:hypothetical protein
LIHKYWLLAIKGWVYHPNDYQVIFLENKEMETLIKQNNQYHLENFFSL